MSLPRHQRGNYELFAKLKSRSCRKYYEKKCFSARSLGNMYKYLDLTSESSPLLTRSSTWRANNHQFPYSCLFSATYLTWAICLARQERDIRASSYIAAGTDPVVFEVKRQIRILQAVSNILVPQISLFNTSVECHIPGREEDHDKRKTKLIHRSYQSIKDKQFQLGQPTSPDICSFS